MARSTHFDVICLVDSLVSVAVFKVESNLDGVIKNRKLVDKEQRKELHQLLNFFGYGFVP